MRVGRLEVDTAGFLLACGVGAVAVWLLLQREWLAVPSLIFSVWWGWHALHDQPAVLDIRNAPSAEAGSEDAAERIDGLCCFCGEAISSDSAEFCELGVTHYRDHDRWQQWLCHGSCFKTRIARPTDDPELFSPFWF